MASNQRHRRICIIHDYRFEHPKVPWSVGGGTETSCKQALDIVQIDECVTVDNESFNLFSYEVPGFIMHGYHHLERFEYDMLPKYIYRVKDVYVEKEICMVYGENTVVVVYHVINGTEEPI